MTLKLVNGIRSLLQGSDPSSPVSGERLLYPKSDGWYEKDSAGNVRRVTNGPAPFMPASGQYYSNPFITAAGSAYATNGTCTWVPIDVGPQTRTFDRIAVNVSTAVSGGTAPALRLGIYADDGTGGKPGSLILDAGTVTITATSIQSITISQALTPGRYWLAALYTHTAAPSTNPQIFQITSGPSVTGNATFTTISRAWSGTGYSAGAMPAVGSAAPVASPCPVIGLRGT